MSRGRVIGKPVPDPKGSTADLLEGLAVEIENLMDCIDKRDGEKSSRDPNISYGAYLSYLARRKAAEFRMISGESR